MQWRHGAHDQVKGTLTSEYVKFREANGLSEDDIVEWAQTVTTRLEETPIIAPGERLGSPPSMLDSGGRPDLDREVRADLLSFSATRVTRALLVVRGLTLRQHAPLVIALIYARRPVKGDGVVLASLGPAALSLTVKRIALDTLETLR